MFDYWDEVGPIFYICNDPERAIGLELSIPNYHIVCIDNPATISSMRDSGVNIFSLSEQLSQINPIPRNSYKLLSHKLVQKYIADNTPDGRTAKVIFFKISPKLEKLSTDLGYKVLNTTSKLNTKYENKISQYNELQHLGYFPETIITRLADIEPKYIFKQLGDEIVLQYDRGHTGTGTVFISNQKQLAEIVTETPSKFVRLSSKIEGETWTINAVATRHGVIAGGLSYQITGIPELTNAPGATVGNDFSKAMNLPNISIEKIVEITIEIGEEMYKGGYRGIFGVDLIIDPDGKIYLIEVNARQPASISMHTKLSIAYGEVPLQAFHICEFTHPENENYSCDYYDIKDPELYVKSRQQILLFDASQIFFRNISDDDKIFSTNLKSGIYESNKFKESAYSINQINGDQLLIFTNQSGQIVTTGNDMIRIQALKSLTDEYKHFLTQFDTLEVK